MQQKTLSFFVIHVVNCLTIFCFNLVRKWREMIKQFFYFSGRFFIPDICVF